MNFLIGWLIGTALGQFLVYLVVAILALFVLIPCLLFFLGWAIVKIVKAIIRLVRKRPSSLRS